MAQPVLQAIEQVIQERRVERALASLPQAERDCLILLWSGITVQDMVIAAGPDADEVFPLVRLAVEHLIVEVERRIRAGLDILE